MTGNEIIAICDGEMIIRPYEGVGPVSFGMTREQVREALASPVNPFYRTPDSRLPTDAFDDLGLQVEYRAPDICQFVSIGHPPAIPIFQGELLLYRPFAQIRDYFLAIDPESELDRSGLNSFKFGIAFYAPFWKEAPEEPAQTVAAFERGYWDRED